MRALLLLLVTLFVSSSAFATTSPIAGTWQADWGDEDVRGAEASIERVVQDMNALIRPMARRPLRSECVGWQSLEIEITDATTAVTADGSRNETARGAGMTSDGASIRHEWVNGVLVETLSTSRGSRTNRYLVISGRLRVDSIIRSPRLPRAVRFSYHYRRVNFGKP